MLVYAPRTQALSRTLSKHLSFRVSLVRDLLFWSASRACMPALMYASTVPLVPKTASWCQGRSW